MQESANEGFIKCWEPLQEKTVNLGKETICRLVFKENGGKITPICGIRVQFIDQ